MTSHELGGADIVRVSATSGQVVVTAEDRRDVEVSDADVGRDDTDGALTIRVGSDTVEVRVPEGCSVLVGTRSGGIVLAGRFGSVGASTESGSISIEAARSVDVRTTSGEVTVGRATTACRARSQSGHVEIGETADLHAHTESGSIVVDGARGNVRVRTTSGHVDIGVQGASDIAAETIDGTIALRLADGLGAVVEGSSSSGEVHNTAPPGADCRIAARSVSGTIEVRSR